jgi:methylase of polypeptide subunit release factors
MLQLCLDAGVLTIADGEASPFVVITPFEDTLLFASDAPRLRAINPDIVIGPSSTTHLLAKAALRTRCSSLLDLGTGSGVMSVFAAGFSDRVVGTDVNERAVLFARFNAALNGINNAEFLAGDAFAPVEGKRFSRILANPPFFLSAKKQFTYSDSPLELDGFTRKIAIEAPQHLEDNGVFQMICEWVQVDGEPWTERLRSWTIESGCDVLVLLGPKVNAMDYSEMRFHEAGKLHTGNTETLMSERLNYLREHHVEYVMSGILNMRKRKGGNWFLVVPGDLNDKSGNAILERMECLAFVAEHSEAQWLNSKLRFAPDALIRQTRALEESGWQIASMQVTKPNLIAGELKIDLAVLEAIELFDGKRTVQQIADTVAELQGISSEEAKSRCLALAKRLVQGAFVLPVGNGKE